MRVVYFSRDYTTHDRRFLARLARSPHEVLYLRLEDDGVGYERRPLPDGVAPVRWSGGTTPRPRFEERLRLVPELERLLAELRPDLVHAGPVPSCAFLAALAGARPLVAMSWGSDLLVEARRDALAGWAAAFALRRSAAAIGDCAAVRAALEEYLPPDRVVTFPWGVDLAEFRPRGGRSPLRASLGWEQATVVLSTRTWAPGYGLEVVLEAFRVAHGRAPDLRLILLGDGPLAPRVAETLRAHRLEEAVHRPGMVPEEELPRFFGAADVYLSASPSDGTSVSLLQALASGLVPIVSDVPGNREWVDPATTGLVAPAADVAGFAAALVAARDAGPAWRAERGARGRAVAEARADWERNSEALFGAYELAARDAGGRPGGAATPSGRG